MKEKYTHEEIARLASPTSCGSAGAARSVRLKLIGPRRKVPWACGIRERSSSSRVAALSQKKVPIANPEFSVVGWQGLLQESGLRRDMNA
jgi:hypothetical protein